MATEASWKANISHSTPSGLQHPRVRFRQSLAASVLAERTHHGHEVLFEMTCHKSSRQERLMLEFRVFLSFVSAIVPKAYFSS